MRYDDLLKQETVCPFCPESMDRQHVIAEGVAAYLTIARAPYVEDHLLVIPKKHREDLANLTLLEEWSCRRLIMKGIRLLRRHNGYTVLARNGEGVGKSIGHVHFHIVPDIVIGADSTSPTRRVLSPPEMKRVVKRLSKG